MQNLLNRVERLLSHRAFFYAGLAAWLLNSILASTFVGVFMPGAVSKLLRYAALCLVVFWSVSHSKGRVAIVPAFMLAALAMVLVTRSFRAVRYSLILLIPLGELLGDQGLSSKGAWARLLAAALMVVAALNADSVKLLDLAIFILAASDLEPDGIANLALVMTATLVSAVFLLASFGIVTDYVMDAGVASRTRHFMGFGYALFPARYLFLITALVAYLKRDKVGVLVFAELLVANAVVYELADSRLAFYSAVLLLAVVVLATHTPLCRLLDFRPIQVLVVAIVPICAVVAVVLAAFYDPSIGWMARLNASGILTGRLKLGHDALATMGIPALGQKLEFVGNGLVSVGKAKPSGSYNYVDSIYVQILVNYGPVIWALVVALQTATLAEAVRKRNLALVAILVLFAGQGIIDDAPLMLQYNTFLLMCAPLVSAPLLSRVLGRIAAPMPHELQTQDGNAFKKRTLHVD